MVTRARGAAIALVGLFLLLTTGQADAQLAPASAEVTRVTGRVEMMAKGQPAWTVVTPGARLVEGDQVRALSGASADLSLPDGSTILVAENSRFAVTKLQYSPQTRERNASFHVVAGKVRAQVSQAAVQLARARQSNFTISTPAGVAAVRGTIAIVLYNPRTGETLIFALPSPGQDAAAARVTYVTRAGQQVTVTGNNFVRQQGSAAPSGSTPISTLAPAAQAAVTNAGNTGTANAPELQGFQVTIITSTQDEIVLQQALAVGPPTTTTEGATVTTYNPVNPGVGTDLFQNSQQAQPAAPCVPSSSTTCP